MKYVKVKHDKATGDNGAMKVHCYCLVKTAGLIIHKTYSFRYCYCETALTLYLTCQF